MSLLRVMMRNLSICLLVLFAVQFCGLFAKPVAETLGATVVKVGNNTETVCLYGFEKVNGTCKEIFWLKVSLDFFFCFVKTPVNFFIRLFCQHFDFFQKNSVKKF